MLETLLIALGSAIVTGLVTWGGIRVELRWLRRDVDRLDKRVDRVEGALIGRGARNAAEDLAHNPAKH